MRKKTLAMAAAAVAVVAGAGLLNGVVATAHSRAAAPRAKTSSGPITIGFPLPGPAPYITGYMDKFNQLVAQHPNVTLVQTLGDWTQATQTSQIDTMITQHPSVVIIWAADNTAVIPALAQISGAGIPVTATNAQPEPQATQYIKGYTGPNDVLQGYLAGEALVKALAPKKAGEVAMIRGTAGTAANTNRAKGFNEALAKFAPGLKLVADQNSQWSDVALTDSIATGILEKNPKVIGMFVQDDTSAAGAVEAEQALHLKIKITGVGGSCLGFKLIRQGTMSATTDQDPWADATDAFDAALDVAEGKAIPKIKFLSPPVLTKANVSKYTCHW